MDSFKGTTNTSMIITPANSLLQGQTWHQIVNNLKVKKQTYVEVVMYDKPSEASPSQFVLVYLLFSYTVGTMLVFKNCQFIVQQGRQSHQNDNSFSWHLQKDSIQIRVATVSTHPQPLSIQFASSIAYLLAKEKTPASH